MTSGNSGLIETITDSISLHSLKKEGICVSSKLPSPVERDSIEPLSENLIHAVDSELQYCILEEGDVNVEVPNYPQSYTLLTYFIKVSLWPPDFE